MSSQRPSDAPAPRKDLSQGSSWADREKELLFSDGVTPSPPAASSSKSVSAQPPADPIPPRERPASTQAKSGSGDDRKRRKVKPQYDAGELIAERYEVVQMLGHGGMGIVYKVRDMQTDQILALKTLLPQYTSHKQAVNRFMREITAARQLDHPCIVKVFDAQKTDTHLFYTMEFLEGTSLFKWMKKRGQMGLGSVVRVLTLLCKALEHAHQVTVHRDLSPDNVMILKDGTIKLVDFGLAKLTNVESNFTMIGVSLGKQQYMAPEQRISAAEVDHRADLYSLGVMFHEMLTGELPQDGVKITKLRPDLPKESEAFLKKALAFDANERFSDAREFRHALAKLYEAHSGKAIPVEESPRPLLDEATPPPPVAPVASVAPRGWVARIQAWIRRRLVR
ncbi:MAG: hypothetical protein AMXMBFR84_05510 [Candidatus Hydrogenedentota bacterium]